MRSFGSCNAQASGRARAVCEASPSKNEQPLTFVPRASSRFNLSTNSARMPGEDLMAIENEPVSAEKMRKKKFAALFGRCLDCGAPVMEGQEFFRSEDGIRHALCVFDPAFAKQIRALELNKAR